MTSSLSIDNKSCICNMILPVAAEIDYRVSTVEDGRPAARQVRQENPEIPLSDLNMPGKSGKLSWYRCAGATPSPNVTSTLRC